MRETITLPATRSARRSRGRSRSSDDCEGCGEGEPRVVVMLEEVGGAGTGVIAHLSPANARRLRTAITDALREIGADGP